ncbi:MAG: hypothetical protein RMJ37_07080 [Spirochaetia bacterium]|nr:hypothetical protein [Spirochaetota bacterium]MDW8113078.1 hypothetical protein [Spirochaetia bacterium]
MKDKREFFREIMNYILEKVKKHGISNISKFLENERHHQKKEEQ